MRIAHPNPALLTWARTSINLTVEQAASKLGISVDTLRSIETGDHFPSFSQLDKLSNLYKRPLAVFYLPTIPKDFLVFKDFRKLPDAPVHPYSTELCLLIQDTQERVLTLAEIMEDEDCDELDFVGRFVLSDDTKTIASEIRKTLNTKADQVFWSREDALNRWIEKVENSGVFVFQAGNEVGKKIKPKEVRGFAIAHKLSPFIFLNEGDTKAARIFTLLHELVHIWLAESGASNLGFRSIDYSDYDPIEVKCNAVAAEVLLPSDHFSAYVEQLMKVYSSPDQIVSALSSRYKLSKVMILRRVYDCGYVNRETFLSLSDEYREDWLIIEDKLKVKDEVATGFPSPYLMKTIHNGKYFTRYVLNLYEAQRITPGTASSLLRTRVDKFPELAKRVQR